MITQIITCDNCNSTKKKSNHWFEIEINGMEIVIKPIPIISTSTLKKHVCGEKCVLELISKHLPGGKIESKSQSNEKTGL